MKTDNIKPPPQRSFSKVINTFLLFKRVKMILLIISVTILLTISCLFLIIALNSPGKLTPLLDNNKNRIDNSISLKEYITIGGINQGFFLRSENPNNPIILFLHGGPGSPELPLIEAREKEERLEKYFTVCYWDQRGAGMSYSSDLSSDSLTLCHYIEDTRQITEYLMKRFGKEKIYLLGHSWGTLLGIKIVEKYPDYYYAYVGIGQVTHQLKSERLAYDYMLEYAKTIKDDKGIKVLESFDRDAENFPTFSYLGQARSNYMNKYGIGITHIPYSNYNLARDVMLFKGYTFREKINYIRGSLFSLTNVFPCVLDDNLFESSTSFNIPIYVLHGVYDYQVSYTLAKEWLEKINAPAKKFYSFQQSAHSPNMEENEKFINIVREIANLHP